MSTLLLIKHSQPVVQAALPSNEWPLSDVGRERCAALAERLRAYAPAALIGSTELKAVQTAELLARELGVAAQTRQDLHEHDRTNVPMMDTRDFLGSMALVFKRPGERVLGRESADEAFARFDRAVQDVLRDRPEGNVAIVAHGTVIALFVSRHAGLEPYALFRQMGLPSFVAMSLPDLRVVERVDRV